MVLKRAVILKIYYMPNGLRGLVKLKIIQESEKNSDWPQATHPPPYLIFIFFWKQLQQQK